MACRSGPPPTSRSATTFSTVSTSWSLPASRSTRRTTATAPRSLWPQRDVADGVSTDEEHHDGTATHDRNGQDACRELHRDVYLNGVFNDDDVPLVVGLVRFTPGARTDWHSHANGQLLVCTDGVGLVSTRDGTTVRLRAGESAWTPPGQEHWHGGTADTMMCHYVILDETPGRDATTWLEPVTEE